MVNLSQTWRASELMATLGGKQTLAPTQRTGSPRLAETAWSPSPPELGSRPVPGGNRARNPHIVKIAGMAPVGAGGRETRGAPAYANREMFNGPQRLASSAPAFVDNRRPLANTPRKARTRSICPRVRRPNRHRTRRTRCPARAPRNRDVTPPEHAGPPNARGPKIMAFRKRSGTPLPTPEQSRRQGDVVRSAWRHFGEPGPVIAFLNTTHESLNGQPLHLAIESDSWLGASASVARAKLTKSLAGGYNPSARRSVLHGQVSRRPGPCFAAQLGRTRREYVPGSQDDP